MGNWKLGQSYRKNANPNMLEGLPAIATFLGKSANTVRRWIMEDGLPCTKLPNGIWFTHKGLILQWIYAGHEAIVKGRAGYALEPDELADLAKKMGIDPSEVYERIKHDQGIGRERGPNTPTP